MKQSLKDQIFQSLLTVFQSQNALESYIESNLEKITNLKLYVGKINGNKFLKNICFN